MNRIIELILFLTIKITIMQINKVTLENMVAEFGLDAMEKHFGVSEVSKILKEKTVGSFDEKKFMHSQQHGVTKVSTNYKEFTEAKTVTQ